MDLELPSARGYWIGALVIALTVVAVAVIVWRGVHTLDQHHISRVLAPGTVTFHAGRGEHPSIFLETHARLHGETYDAPDDLGQWQLLATGPHGRSVRISQPFVHETYSTPSHTGRRVGRLETGGHAGTYRVEVRPAPRRELAPAPSPTVFAVGSLPFVALIASIFGAIGVALVGGGGGLAIIIVTAVRRSGARRRLQAAQYLQETNAPPLTGFGPGPGPHPGPGPEFDRYR